MKLLITSRILQFCHRLVLTAEGNKLKVEARLTRKAEELGLKSRDLGKKAKALPAVSPERLQVEQEIEEIFSWLKTAPEQEVVVVTHSDEVAKRAERIIRVKEGQVAL